MITINLHDLILVAVALLVGWLVGRYTGNGAKNHAENRGPSATHDQRIDQLMDKKDPFNEEDEEGTPHMSYKRRDKPERRDDWARYMRAQQERDQDHDEDQ